MPETHTLVIEDCPPSLNAIAGRGNNWKYRSLKKDWDERFTYAVRASTLTGPAKHVKASCVFRFPQKRRRDGGNLRFFPEKCLGDVLQNEGVLPDDTWEFYQFHDVSVDPERGPKRMTIKLEVAR